MLTLMLAGLMSAGEAVGQEHEETGKVWDIRLGIGASYHPDYDGSNDYELSPLPVFSVVYRRIVFLRGPTPMLGANAVSWEVPGGYGKVQLGPLVKYEAGRRQNDNRALRGLGDIDRGIEAGGFVVWRDRPWSGGLIVLQDVLDSHSGLTARLDAGLGFRMTPEVRGSMIAWATWADGDYMSSFFGVTPAQAARSGLRQHRAGAGFKEIGLAVRAEYSFTDHWGVGSRVSYHRLLGDAATSPIVRDRGSADQFTVSLYVSYRF